MKTSLIIPMPDMRNAQPYLDRTTLVVDLDIDRAIAGEAFSETASPQTTQRHSLPLPVEPVSCSWMAIN
jgi:hypothetical protein